MAGRGADRMPRLRHRPHLQGDIIAMPVSSPDIDWEYLLERLERLLDLGEEYLTRHLADFRPTPQSFEQFIAFRWQRENHSGYLAEVAYPDLPDDHDLLGIDEALTRLKRNTAQFVGGLPANNVLLWGARGNGKSSAIKCLLNIFGRDGLRLVEVQKEDLFQLPQITTCLREMPFRFILFCDDLSFTEEEVNYRELKALLEGGVEARAQNILVYATSNRRHLLPESHHDNLGDLELHPEDSIAEKLSLSDRFGITIGFYPMRQGTYLDICRHLSRQRDLSIDIPQLEKAALQWAMLRGARSGRVARQFIDDLTGQLALREKTSPDRPPQ
jgi:hypothetical protein